MAAAKAAKGKGAGTTGKAGKGTTKAAQAGAKATGAGGTKAPGKGAGKAGLKAAGKEAPKASAAVAPGDAEAGGEQAGAQTEGEGQAGGPAPKARVVRYSAGYEVVDGELGVVQRISWTGLERFMRPENAAWSAQVAATQVVEALEEGAHRRKAMLKLLGFKAGRPPREIRVVP